MVLGRKCCSGFYEFDLVLNVPIAIVIAALFYVARLAVKSLCFCDRMPSLAETCLINAKTVKLMRWISSLIMIGT
jgi:hypothetical protein